MCMQQLSAIIWASANKVDVYNNVHLLNKMRKDILSVCIFGVDYAFI